MLLSDFDFELPPDRIARHPCRPRDGSRLLVVARGATGVLEDSTFRSLGRHLRAGDVLVVNNTRVIPARMWGQVALPTGKGETVEIFFSHPIAERQWAVLCRPARRLPPGTTVRMGQSGSLVGVLGGTSDFGLREIELSQTADRVAEILEAEGTVPIPPYLGREAQVDDRHDYQTVFAARPGAIAAPTAGLHFTTAVVDDLKARDVSIVEVTLHVGTGTFRPVRASDPREHRLAPERYEIGPEAARDLNLARSEGRRIVCVGTTTVRTLESAVRDTGGVFEAGTGEAAAFILPGHRFEAADALVTNFHMPKSTLFMLVCAFGTADAMRYAYGHAINAGYRFYSYGDAMLIA